jgi:hypothetical protein
MGGACGVVHSREPAMTYGPTVTAELWRKPTTERYGSSSRRSFVAESPHQ